MNGQPDSENLDIKYAMDWITMNKDTIKSRCCRLSTVSPYGTDDFLQTAYCVAIKVVEEFPEDRQMFRKHFWRSFWSEVKEMTSRSVPTYVCGEEMVDSLGKLLREIGLEGKQNEVENDRQVQDTVQTMAPRQMEVWQELLNPGCYTSRDVAGATHRAARAAKCMGTRHAYVKEERYQQVRVMGEVA